MPEPFSNTPNTGIVQFVDANGYDRIMDFLFDPFGSNTMRSTVGL